MTYTEPMENDNAQNIDPIPSESFFEFAAAAEDKPATAHFLAFNTVIELQAYGNEAEARAAFEEARTSCRTYERLLSRTLPHSDISRINAAAGRPVAIDRRTFDLLQKAVGYCAVSEGAFDITVGPLVRLWDFHRGRKADPSMLAYAAKHVNWRNLKLWEEESAKEVERDHESESNESNRQAQESPSTAPTFWAQLTDPQAAVDVGGIAKGWIADALMEDLQRHGLSGIIVNLGGNVLVSGTKPDGSPWRVGVRDPRNPAELLGAVPLARGSAVTSGIYERCFTDSEGRFYHHILSPLTGQPVDTDVAGVTVVCEKSIDAEGFSTTLLALGTERGRALVERYPEIAQAFFVDAEGVITPARV
ncbi:FAD:protein FMN transferase [Adlercreutzia equolifaciens]|uniref:FAD:protein FMN transferase n=1 Tax=Adlercreutzia equolifaciens TaxID=446660 RepID=UPI0023B05EA9|nr:FAD:protein FMN transferase [Adlercreutzia equolifaciens]MDE8702727.1 FAD:protein FMN transferase [Adlercreutzia equolifaciens]